MTVNESKSRKDGKMSKSQEKSGIIEKVGFDLQLDFW